MISCPFCNKELTDTALRCKYCRNTLPGKEIPKKPFFVNEPKQDAVQNEKADVTKNAKVEWSLFGIFVLSTLWISSEGIPVFPLGFLAMLYYVFKLRKKIIFIICIAGLVMGAIGIAGIDIDITDYMVAFRLNIGKLRPVLAQSLNQILPNMQ